LDFGTLLAIIGGRIAGANQIPKAAQRGRRATVSAADRHPLGRWHLRHQRLPAGFL